MSGRPGWRLRVGALAALAAVAGLLTLPTRDVPSRPAAAGPSTLASVWPKAKPATVPAGLPDGSTYSPMMILDATTSVGQALSADAATMRLVVVSAGGALRVLQSVSATSGSSIDAITSAGGNLYWMTGELDAHGIARASLWTAPLAGGETRKVPVDVGSPLFAGSSYDLLVGGDGRLYWTAAPIGPRTSTEIRSTPLGGDRVAVRHVDGDYALSGWPWLATIPGATGAPAQLLNLSTGEHHTVAAKPEEQLSCSPTWCLITALPESLATTPPAGKSGPTGFLDLVRPDGSDRRRISTDGSFPVCDVAVLDRFQLLATTVAAAETTTAARITLYDIAHRRTVEIATAASGVGSRGHYLWWATGDNEAQVWHILDLTSLT